VHLAREPKPLLRWSILILRAKAVWLGDVDAASKAAKGAEQPKERLMAVRRPEKSSPCRNHSQARVFTVRMRLLPKAVAVHCPGPPILPPTPGDRGSQKLLGR
jgi:hypothetical protein